MQFLAWVYGGILSQRRSGNGLSVTASMGQITALVLLAVLEEEASVQPFSAQRRHDGK